MASQRYRSRTSRAAWAAVAAALGACAMASSASAAPSFAPAVHVAAGTFPEAVAVADLNGDAHQDVAVADSAENAVHVRLGDGEGGFGAAESFAVGAGPHDISAGDLDSDGDADLVTADGSTSAVTVLRNDGSADFTASSVGVGAFSPQRLAIGNIVGGAAPDLLVSTVGPDRVVTLAGDGAGGFGAPSQLQLQGTTPDGVAIADVDGAHGNDAVIVSNGSHAVQVTLAAAGGGFQSPTTYAAGGLNPSVPVVQDLNGDGRLDLAVAHSGAGSNSIGVRLGQPGGGLGAVTNFGSGGSNPSHLVAADFDLDGKLDLATPNLNSSNAGVLAGNGSGGFASAVAFGVGGAPSGAATGDLDENGSPDLAVANFGDGTVSILRSTDSGEPPPPDTTAPQLTLPGDIVRDATSEAGASVIYQVTAADDRDPSPAVDCSPASGSTFAIGTTTVSCTATDDSGNEATGQFDVTVNPVPPDTTPPQLDLPAPITAEATGPSGASVDYEATATDDRDPSPVVDCSPASGSTFPLGTTSVQCMATDADGNQASGGFTVTVNEPPPPPDTTPPQLHLPAPITLDATGPAGATVDYQATATDDRDSSPGVDCSPASGATFAIGKTTVQCAASDADGNETAGSFDVTVLGAGQLDPSFAGLRSRVKKLRLSRRTEGKLLKPLATAQAAANAGDDTGACTALAAFAAKVQALKGKAISRKQAKGLLADAGDVGALLSC